MVLENQSSSKMCQVDTTLEIKSNLPEVAEIWWVCNSGKNGNFPISVAYYIWILSNLLSSVGFHFLLFTGDDKILYYTTSLLQWVNEVIYENK